jgi:phage/plasmid-associated DNA primase
VPESSREQAEEARRAGSPVRAFVEDCTSLDGSVTTSVHDLYTAYRAWCEDAGREHPEDELRFGRQLTSILAGSRGVTKVRRSHGVVWIGVRSTYAPAGGLPAGLVSWAPSLPPSQAVPVP